MNLPTSNILKLFIPFFILLFDASIKPGEEMFLKIHFV